MQLTTPATADRSVNPDSTAAFTLSPQTGITFYPRARIPRRTFLLLIKCFAEDLSATETANLTGVTRKSVTGIFLKLRRRLADECERVSPALVSRLREDPALSCTRCACGRCRRGLSLKSPVFALVAENGKVFGKEIPDCRKPILRAVIRRHVDPRSLPVDGWHGYDALVDTEVLQPYLIDHVEASFADSERAKAAEGFWRFARLRLQKFNGVPNRTFNLHLKESEWRFNLRGADLYNEVLKLIEKNPL
jgi:hypothetical protein